MSKICLSWGGYLVNGIEYKAGEEKQLLRKQNEEEEKQEGKKKENEDANNKEEENKMEERIIFNNNALVIKIENILTEMGLSKFSAKIGAGYFIHHFCLHKNQFLRVGNFFLDKYVYSCQ